MSLQAIKDGVDEAGGVKSFPMWQVRDAYGAGRLGIHVRAGISKALHGLGLGHYPGDLPDSQTQFVRLHRLGTPTADLIEAVLHPGPEGDQRLLAASSGEAEAVLVKVRELVC